MKKDYYEILGLPKNAELAQIKKKYRSLALKYHPDRVSEDKKKESEETFKEISEAYGVLSDPKKRQMYDQYGHAGIDQNFTAEDIFRGADFGNIFGESGLGDIFSEFFGGGFGSQARRRGPERGRDIQFEMDITLEEAFKGIKKEIKIPRDDMCKKCNGSGAKDSSKVKTCPTCQGSGHVSVASGFFRMQQACHDCRGAGQIITEYCPQCHGRKTVRVTRKISVNVPAGVDNSSRLRMSGEGEIGPGGSGDLYLYIHVLEHETFKRNGDDLYLQLPVSFVVAALGGEISVPIVAGKVSMKIPAGTQSGKVFRLKEKGMPRLQGGKGDLYAKAMIQVPTKLSAQQKKILQEYASLSGEEVQEQESIKDKIKKVFQ